MTNFELTSICVVYIYSIVYALHTVCALKYVFYLALQFALRIFPVVSETIIL